MYMAKTITCFSCHPLFNLHNLLGKTSTISAKETNKEICLRNLRQRCYSSWMRWLNYNLLDTLEACCLKQSNIRSLDFAVDRFLMKLFKTPHINVIKDYIYFFDFKLSSTLLLARTETFLSNCNINNNSICNLFGSVPATVHSRWTELYIYIYIYIYIYVNICRRPMALLYVL